MSKLDDFLAVTSPGDNPDRFAKLAIEAALEIRAAELGTTIDRLAASKDEEALGAITGVSLRGAPPFENLPESDTPGHLARVAKNWEQTGKATLFRGTRLPEHRGTFEFGGVHLSPQFIVADAYARGSTNTDTGVGRLFKEDGLGFLTAWEIPLAEKTYRNFQYESFIKEPDRYASDRTLTNLKDEMKQLSSQPAAAFDTSAGYATECSKALEHLSCDQNHYEVVASLEHAPAATYMRFDGGLLKTNPDDPKWARLMSRLQEASLRDFYEIRPLENVEQALRHAHTDGDPIKAEIADQVRKWVADEKAERANAPWEAKSLDDVSLSGSPYVDARPYITQSERVGSASNANRVLPESIETWSKIANYMSVDRFKEAQQLIQTLKDDYVPVDVDRVIEIRHARTDEVLFRHASPNNEHAETMRAAIGANIDLEYAQLSRFDLRGMDLRGVNLLHADLYDARLEDTKLYQRDVAGARLPGRVDFTPTPEQEFESEVRTALASKGIVSKWFPVIDAWHSGLDGRQAEVIAKNAQFAAVLTTDSDGKQTAVAMPLHKWDSVADVGAAVVPRMDPITRKIAAMPEAPQPPAAPTAVPDEKKPARLMGFISSWLKPVVKTNDSRPRPQ